MIKFKMILFLCTLVLYIVTVLLYLLRIDEYLGLNKSTFHCDNIKPAYKFFFKSEKKFKNEIKTNFLKDEELYELTKISEGAIIPDSYGGNGFCVEYNDSIYPVFKSGFFKTKPWRKYQMFVEIVHHSDSLLVFKNERRERFEEDKVYYDSIIFSR